MITKYNRDYHFLLNDIIRNGEIILNKRTNTKVKTLYHKQISIDLSNRKVPMINTRKMYPRSAAAELAWTIKGSQETYFIKKYSKMWSKFEDKPGIVIPAYGYRWQYHFNRNQLNLAIKALELERSNRQIFISAWDPSEDGLTNIGKYKNVPCPIGFMLNVDQNNKLNMSVIMRSSDAVVGLPYDIMMYAMLNIILANTLSINPGVLTIYLNNVHIYEPHFDSAKIMVQDNYIERYNYIDPEFRFGRGWTVIDVKRDPDKFVSHIATQSKLDKYPDALNIEVIE